MASWFTALTTDGVPVFSWHDPRLSAPSFSVSGLLSALHTQSKSNSARDKVTLWELRSKTAHISFLEAGARDMPGVSKKLFGFEDERTEI